MELYKNVLNLLKDFCFRNIWNQPNNEYRNNIKPKKLSRKSNGTVKRALYTGVIDLAYGITIPLPTSNTPYIVCSVLDKDYHGICNISPYTWTNTRTLSADSKVILHTYVETGMTIPKKDVWLYYNKHSNSFLLAIDFKIYNKLIDDLYLHHTIYTTIYYNSSMSTNVTVYSEFIDTDDKYNTLINLLDMSSPTITNKNETRLLFINGYEVDISINRSYMRNTHVDVIIDENIVYDFTVDLTDKDHSKQYISDRDKLSKYIIHPPKELNEDNIIITHNTCDVFARYKYPRDVGMGLEYIRGTYIHRCGDKSINQLTHSDMSIPSYIVDAHRDHLKTQDITLRVIVRKHDFNNNFLYDDNSYIKLLYLHNNKDILNILKGSHISDKLPFWKASNLEYSKFLYFMFHTVSMNADDIDDINAFKEKIKIYLDGLGYFKVLSLLSKRIFDFIITDSDNTIIRCEKPFMYTFSKSLSANVYYNNKKVNNEFVKLSITDKYIYIQLEFIELKQHDKVSVEFLTNDTKSIYVFNPIDTDRDIQVGINNQNVKVFLRNDYHLSVAKGIKRTSNYSYTDITNSSDLVMIEKLSNDLSKIHISNELYDKTLIIMSDCATRHFNFNLTQSMNEMKTLVVSLDSSAINTDDVIPIIDFGQIYVYLNNKYLVKDVDFTIIQPLHPINNKPSFTQISINNINYLNETGDNYIEIITNGDTILDESFGHVRDDIYVPNKKDIVLYFKENTMVHVNGYLESEIEDKGNYFIFNKGKYETGDIVNTKFVSPNTLKAIFKYFKTEKEEATNRITLLKEYFYKFYSGYPEKSVIVKSHNIYSIFLSTIIKDVLDGTLSLSYDIDMVSFEKQLIDYLHIKEFDVVIREYINYKFIDAYPHYRQLLITDPHICKMITLFMDFYLPKDDTITGDTIYGED